MDVVKNLWHTEYPNKLYVIDTKFFYDGTLKYLNIDRIGGVLSHLKKVHRNEMLEQLGKNHQEIIYKNDIPKSESTETSMYMETHFFFKSNE